MNKLNAKFIKKLTAMALIGAMTLGSVPHITLANESEYSSSVYTKSSKFTTHDVLALEPFVYVTPDGLFGLDKESVVKNGIHKDLIAMQLSAFEFLNDRALKGEIKINFDLSIDDFSTSTTTTRNGINRYETHWWGQRRYASTAEASRIASIAGGIAVTGVWFPSIIVPAGIGIAYFALLADRIDSHNARTNRGVIVRCYMGFCF